MDELKFAQQVATVLVDAVVWHHMQLHLVETDIHTKRKHRNAD